MNVDYTGRQFEITPKIRKEVEAGLAKLVKIVGENSKSKVIIAAEKQRRLVEITVSRRTRKLVGRGESTDAFSAIAQALEHIEKQALKLNTRKRDGTRAEPPKWKQEAPEVVELEPIAGRTAAVTAVPVVVHKFPAKPKMAEAHLVKTQDVVSLQPMTIEEAVKECEFIDRGVFVFRDKKNVWRVLHRRKDGKLELIEVP
ncbi:MAG: ribosome-associated translation inhibitor RaiA [Acidobacteriota bacterium]|nr:ribosome-associated translation inhibitor RaiA [Acidobacteriota bacterium]